MSIKTGLAVLAIGGMALIAQPAALSAATPATIPVAAADADASVATEFSAQRRHRHARRYYRQRGNNGAMVGAAAVGIIGSAIAAGAAHNYYQERQYRAPRYYYDDDGDDYAPNYYGSGYQRW